MFWYTWYHPGVFLYPNFHSRFIWSKTTCLRSPRLCTSWTRRRRRGRPSVWSSWRRSGPDAGRNAAGIGGRRWRPTWTPVGSWGSVGSWMRPATRVPAWKPAANPRIWQEVFRGRPALKWRPASIWRWLAEAAHFPPEGKIVATRCRKIVLIKKVADWVARSRWSGQNERLADRRGREPTGWQPWERSTATFTSAMIWWESGVALTIVPWGSRFVHFFN